MSMLRNLCTVKYLRVFLLLSVLVNGVLLLRAFSIACSGPWGSSLEEEGRGSQLSVQLEPNVNPVVSASPQSLAARQIIFVGGVPRSGTTLMRAMLDAHEDIRCGEETRVIPRLLGMRSRWDRSDKEHRRLNEAGMDKEVLDRATRAFISEAILGHGLPSKYLCNKDPLVLSYMHDVIRLYPKSKFVLMVRDGRAVAYSIVSRNVTITGVNSKSYMSAAMFWNKVVTRMTKDCSMLGRHRCLEVRYEKLVKSPKVWMQKVLEFLGVPWSDNVLQHQKFINSEISLSKMELSSSQVKEAVNTGALDKWRLHMPEKVQRDLYKECDMLKALGYPPV